MLFLKDGGECASFRDQCRCAGRKRKNNTDYAEVVRQGADGRAARVLIE